MSVIYVKCFTEVASIRTHNQSFSITDYSSAERRLDTRRKVRGSTHLTNLANIKCIEQANKQTIHLFYNMMKK